jgi:MFS family permease
VPALLGPRSSSTVHPRTASRRRPGRYRLVLQTPGARAFFFGAAPGRAGVAMTSLAVVWLIHWTSGSFGAAGVVAGGLAVGEACGGPQVARLIDRLGQTRILPLSLTVHGISAAAVLVLAISRCPLWTVTVAAVLAGISIPQLGALTAARWTWLLGDSTLLSTAFALESLSNGLAYLVGPVVVAVVSTAFTPIAGPIVAAVMAIGGGCALVVQRGTAPPPAGRPPTRAGAATLRRRGFAVLVVVNVCAGVYFASMQVSVTAFAIDRGAPSAAALLYSISSGASLVAGLAYGLRRWRAGHSTQLFRALVLFGVGCLPVLAVTTVPALAVALVIPGLMIPPVLILAAVLTEALVHRSVLTQAFAWQASASAAGSAAAAAVSGQVVDALGARWGFGLAFAAITVAALAVGLLRTGLRPAVRVAGTRRSG